MEERSLPVLISTCQLLVIFFSFPCPAEKGEWQSSFGRHLVSSWSQLTTRLELVMPPLYKDSPSLIYLLAVTSWPWFHPLTGREGMDLGLFGAEHVFAGAWHVYADHFAPCCQPGWKSWSSIPGLLIDKGSKMSLRFLLYQTRLIMTNEVEVFLWWGGKTDGQSSDQISLISSRNQFKSSGVTKTLNLQKTAE